MVDVDEKTITVEVTGTPEKIVKFEMVMRPYGIAEMVRTGAVSMARGHEPISTVPTSARASKADSHDTSGLSMSV